MFELKVQNINKQFIVDNYLVFSRLSEQLEGDYWTIEEYLKELPFKWKLSEVCITETGNILGFLIASMKIDSFYIHRFVVDFSYQKKGIGSCLLDSLLSKSIKYNAKTISLKVATNNIIAYNYYIKKGFNKIGTVQNIKDPKNLSFKMILKV